MKNNVVFCSLKFAFVKIMIGITITLSLAFNAQSTSHLSDTTPPTLVSFSLSPTSVDVTSSDSTVTLSVNVTDDLSGASDGWAYLYSPSWGQYAAASLYKTIDTAPDAQLEGTFTIPKFSEAGDWKLIYIYLRDQAGNSQYIENPTLETLGQVIVAVNSDIQDISPPNLTSLSLEPSAINVSAGPQSITVSMGISDSPSGVSFNCTLYCYYNISFKSPSGEQRQYEADWNTSQTSGTLHEGIWQTVVTFPQHAENGAWRIESITLRDQTGNIVWLDNSMLISKGFTTNIDVLSSTPDIGKPQLTNIDITPRFIDTTASSVPITFTLKAADSFSGIDSLYYKSKSPNLGQWLHAVYQSPSGGQNIYAYFNGSTPIAGNSNNGIWQTTSYLPQYSESGTWKPSYAYISDNAGNYMRYDSTQLVALGLPNLEVILPSHLIDGTVLDINTETTIKDEVFGDRAQAIIPAGVLKEPTTVKIDVLSSDLNLPIPTGFSTTGTNFVNISLDPKPTPPYPAPGITLVLPVSNQTPPGTILTLYRVDPASGSLTPEPSATPGQPVTGIVNEDGLSATFTGVAALSTVVGLIPTGEIIGDLNGDSIIDCNDMAIVKNAYGKKLGQAGYDSRADINHDNKINIRDLSFVARQLPSGITCRITPTGVIQVNSN